MTKFLFPMLLLLLWFTFFLVDETIEEEEVTAEDVIMVAKVDIVVFYALWFVVCVLDDNLKIIIQKIIGESKEISIFCEKNLRERQEEEETSETRRKKKKEKKTREHTHGWLERNTKLTY